jgi:hypothetical protein
MKKLTNIELASTNGAGFAAGYCGGFTGAMAIISILPGGAAALASNPWSLIWAFGSTVYCAGYFEGKW